MKISQLFDLRRNSGKTVFSIEVFPPKKSTAIDTVYASLEEIALICPDFISVTCGAGGSSIDGQADNPTVEVSSIIKNKCGIESVAHLTCVASARSEVLDTLKSLEQHNVMNVLALRGDINSEVERKTDFTYASDLVSFIRRELPLFGISGGCYPEGHAESDSSISDLKNLKKKVDFGCEILFTQLFFENSLFYSFIEKVRLIGIEIPVSAGIMPITSKKQIERMVSLCGASLPPKLTKMIARFETRPEALRDAGIAYAIEQISDLIANGVDGIHLYAMNSPYVAKKVHESIKSLGCLYYD